MFDFSFEYGYRRYCAAVNDCFAGPLLLVTVIALPIKWMFSVYVPGDTNTVFADWRGYLRGHW
jgi:hypothetical protein